MAGRRGAHNMGWGRERGGGEGKKGLEHPPKHYRSGIADLRKGVMLTGNQQLQPRDLMPERARRIIKGVPDPRGRKGGTKIGRRVGGEWRAKTREINIEARWKMGKSWVAETGNVKT